MVFGIASSAARRQRRKEKKKPEEAPTPTPAPPPTGLARPEAIAIEERRPLTPEEREGLGLVSRERAGGGFDPRTGGEQDVTFEQFEAERARRQEGFAGEQLEQAGAFEQLYSLGSSFLETLLEEDFLML